MNSLPTKKIHHATGPHSRLLQHGLVGVTLDGRSVDGRFLRHAEADLIKHIGGKPSITEMLLIRRLARVMLRIEKFEIKLDRGEWTDHDTRVFGALQNVFLRSISTLGLKPAQARPLTHAERLAQITAAVRSRPAPADDEDE